MKHKTTSLPAGIILLKSNANKERPISQIRYSCPEEELSLSELLLSNFEQLKLSGIEKRSITMQARSNIQFYSNLDFGILNDYAQEITSILNSSRAKHIIIESQGIGGFISLLALYSGEINASKKVEFHMHDVPLSLFPKNWVKSKRVLCEHRFIHDINQGSWLAPLKTLYNRPHHCPLNLEQKSLDDEREAV